MFVTKRQFNLVIKSLEHECANISARYWELRHMHDRLLRHLGLQEKRITEHVVLAELDAPEQAP